MGTKIGKGGPVLAAKIGPGGPFLAADQFFCYTPTEFWCAITSLNSQKVINHDMRNSGM